MEKALLSLSTDLKDTTKNLFVDDNDWKRFHSYWLSFYTKDPSIFKLGKARVNACILQMFTSGADPLAKEAFIIPYKIKGGAKVPMVQNGYKFAERKLWETGELKRKPIVFELHEGEVEHFDKHTRDVRYKTTPITTEQQYLEAQKKKIVGWVARYEMADGSLIEKMYWEIDLHKYNVKYSSGYRSFLKDGTGIWATNMYEMKKKAVFLKSWREYLPKTEKLVQALKEVSRLNNASFETLELNAKPIYYDNPTSSAKELSVTGEVIENKALALKPLEKPASKEAVSELFRFIKENYEDDQKKKQVQKAIWGVAVKLSTAKRLSFNRWYDISWVVLKEICENIAQKTGFKFDIKYPNESRGQ